MNLSFKNAVIIGKFLKFPMPQFFHFYNRNNNTPIAVL